MKPSRDIIPEMTDHLAESDIECAARGWWDAKFSFRVARDIWADVLKFFGYVRGEVYTEEQRNILNAQELHGILADGKVTPDELPKLRQLEQRERKSAAHLHDVTERIIL